MDLGSPVILIVDDNPYDIELTSRVLRNFAAGTSNVTAADGPEALELLLPVDSEASRTPRQTPALVFLDLNIPKLNGLEVLARMRAHPTTRSVPVVMLTGGDNPMPQGTRALSGPTLFVPKPLTKAKIPAILEKFGLSKLIQTVDSASPA